MKILSIKQYITDIKEKKEYADEVWSLIQEYYKKLGGYRGSLTKDKIVNDSYLWTLVKSAEGKVISVGIYKKNRGLQRLIIAAERSTEGKAALRGLVKRDYKKSWAEVPTDTLKFYTETGGKKYFVPNKTARNILRDKTLKLGEDPYTYSKDFKGKTIEYVMVGTPTKIKPEHLGKKFEVLKSKFGSDLPWETLVDLDPTPQKEYLSWLAKIFKNEEIREEDYYKFSDFLYEFDMGKHKLAPEKRDINKVPSISALFNLIQEINPTKNEISQEKRHEAYQEAKIHFDSPTFKIIEPLTKKASCYFGQGTAWCTAATTSGNMFDYYTKDGGRLFIFVTPKGKYQGHTSGEFRDSSDDIAKITEVIDESLVRMLPSEVILDTLVAVDLAYFQYVDNESISEEKRIELATEYPEILKYMSYQTHETCLAAIKRNPEALEFVKEQTTELCMAAVQQDGGALRFVREQTPEICLAAVQQNGRALQYVKEQTPEICMAAVQQDGRALKYVKEQTPEICLAAVQNYGMALEYVKEQTPVICMAAVQQSGRAIRWVNVQTPELCYIAFRQNPDSLQMMSNPPYELCLEAVRQDGLLIRFIANKTHELSLAAVQNNGLALRFLTNKTPEICMAAVQQNGMALEYVRIQTLDICIAAVDNDPQALVYVLPIYRLEVLEYLKGKK